MTWTMSSPRRRVSRSYESRVARSVVILGIIVPVVRRADHVDRPRAYRHRRPDMKILALDLAKSKSVCCLLDTATGETQFQDTPGTR